MPIKDFDFCLKNPVERISFSSSPCVAPAMARASGNLANRAGVTRFTLASVDWAERMVATSSSYGVAMHQLRIGIRVVPIERIEDLVTVRGVS